MSRWPLHPTPHEYESLDRYVRRLSKSYGASYETFCLHALGIPQYDIEARDFRHPSDEVIARLSEGTGIPCKILIEMTLYQLMDRMLKELGEYLADPEASAKFESILNNSGSQTLSINL